MTVCVGSAGGVLDVPDATISAKVHLRLTSDAFELVFEETGSLKVPIATEILEAVINPRFVDRMFETWSDHPQRDRIAAIHPKYRDPKTGRELLVRRAKDGGPITSMTSGALMPVWAFDKIGWFASEYFIDCVDTEYGFRIRAAGYLIADSTRAELPHAAGNSQVHTILGFSFQPTYHSTMRRYYMARNCIVVFRKYVSIFPRWAFIPLCDSICETIKCLLGEPDRSVKLRRFLLGTWDGLTGRMGKREGL